MSRSSSHERPHRSQYVVAAGDVDASGHMSVRRYGEIAEKAAIGAAQAVLGTSRAEPLRVLDTLARHHREQFEGTLLTIDPRVLAAGDDTLVVHVELQHRAADQLASAHRIVVPMAAREAALCRANLPRLEDGDPPTSRPRRLSSGPLPFWPADRLLTADLEVWSQRTFTPEDHAAAGNGDLGPADLAWGPPDAQQPTQWRFETPAGRHYALAAVEYRRTVASLPAPGAHLLTLAANVAVEGKRRVRREWTLDADRGTVHVAGEFVDVLIDLAARRAVEVPPSIRAQLGRYHRPELGAPDPTEVHRPTDVSPPEEDPCSPTRRS